MDYAKMIKELRSKLILSQTEFAELLGISYNNGFEAITASGMKISQVYDGNRISTIDYNLSKNSNSDVKLCNMNDGNVTSVTNCYAMNGIKLFLLIIDSVS